jgi:hypothetical protein
MTTTVTTTMWVVNSVHNNTADAWADAHAALAACRTDFDVLVLFVTDNTDASHALEAEFADFTAWHTNECVVAFFRHKLCLRTS